MSNFIHKLEYYLDHPNSFSYVLIAVLVAATACGLLAIYMESSNTGESIPEFVSNRIAGKQVKIRGPEAIAAKGRSPRRGCETTLTNGRG